MPGFGAGPLMDRTAWLWWPPREVFRWVARLEAQLDLVPQHLPESAISEPDAFSPATHITTKPGSPSAGTVGSCNHIRIECAIPYDYRLQSRLRGLHGQSARHGPRRHKLDQEPASSSAPHRATLETLRGLERHEYRPWPRLPAADQFTDTERQLGPDIAQEGEAPSPFVFGILTPGYALETVEVSLVPPAEVPVALAALSQARDQIQARLFPVLTPVQPMPSPNYGLVIAMPAWAHMDVGLCMDLQDIDGRLYVELGPTVADKATLLKLVGLPEEAPIDIYLGAESVPLPDHEARDLYHGMSVFFVPRHALPGPYYNLVDVLLSSYAWDEDAYTPPGPDAPLMCIVTDSGPRTICFDDEAAYGDTGILARALGMPAEQLCVQPAVPAIVDVAIKGRPCRGVCGVSALVPSDPDSPIQDLVPPVLGLIDCRALLQGWDLLISTEGRLPFSDLNLILETFTPPHWELYLERATPLYGQLRYAPGHVVFASYVPLRAPAPAVELEQAAAEETADSEAPTDDPPLGPDSPAAIVAFPPAGEIGQAPTAADPLSISIVPGIRPRSRSPHRTSAEPAVGATAPEPGAAGSDLVRRPDFMALFLILAPDLIPEMVTVWLPGPTAFASAYDRVQAARAPLRRRRLARLIPVQPQPRQDHVVLLALPVWSRDVYIVCDCMHVNGTIFCAFCPASTDRASLLAIAGFGADASHEVYVHDLLGPLAAHEQVDVESGYCVSFLPDHGAILVVSDVDDR